MKRDIAEKEIKGQAEKSCSKFWNYRNYNKCNCKCWFEISRIRKMARVKEIAISNVIFITHFFFLSFFFMRGRGAALNMVSIALTIVILDVEPIQPQLRS